MAFSDTPARSITDWLEANSHMVDSWHMEDDAGGEESEGPWGYWIYLKPPYGNIGYDVGLHIIHEHTAKAALYYLERAGVCICDECEKKTKIRFRQNWRMSPAEQEIFNWALAGLVDALEDQAFIRDNPGILGAAPQKMDMIYRIGEQYPSMLLGRDDITPQRRGNIIKIANDLAGKIEGVF